MLMKTCATVFALLVCAAVGAQAQSKKGSESNVSGVATLSRPFATQELQLADVLIVIPKDWIDAGFVSLKRGSGGFVHLTNLNDRPSPRASHFDMPPLNSFVMTVPAQGLAANNIAQTKVELQRRWQERQPDEHGFWRWKPAEYVLTSQTHKRPFDQPLTIQCVGSPRPKRGTERRCEVGLYWTSNTSVRYAFFDTDIPESQWVELDKRVLELVQFLEGSERAR
jgi:hypothetical protein